MKKRYQIETYENMQQISFKIELSIFFTFSFKENINTLQFHNI